MVKFTLKMEHQPTEEGNLPVVVTVDGKELLFSAGDSKTLDIGSGLYINVAAVNEKGVPLGNTVSEPRQPGIAKSATDPRTPAGEAGHSTQHEPNSPPNPGKTTDGKPTTKA